MIRRRNKERDESTIDITPMLDIVFIMLIFFIVTTSFVKETGVEVNRPNAATAVRDERGNILIAITANDEIWIDKRRVDLKAVRANIERLKIESLLQVFLTVLVVLFIVFLLATLKVVFTYFRSKSSRTKK